MTLSRQQASWRLHGVSPAIPALSFRNVTKYTVFSPKSSELPSSCPGRGCCLPWDQAAGAGARKGAAGCGGKSKAAPELKRGHVTAGVSEGLCLVLRNGVCAELTCFQPSRAVLCSLAGCSAVVSADVPAGISLPRFSVVVQVPKSTWGGKLGGFSPLL